MPLDMSKLSSDMEAEDKKAHDLAHRRSAAVLRAFHHRVELNANDPVVQAIEVILGTAKDGGSVEDAVKLLGFHPNGSTVSTEPPAIPAVASDEAPQDRPKPVFNADGTLSGIAMREPQAMANGYGFRMEGDVHVGWQKPVEPVAPAPEPEEPTEAERVVFIHDSKGRATPRKVTVNDGNANPGLEAVLGDDARVAFFQEKPRFVLRKAK